MDGIEDAPLVDDDVEELVDEDDMIAVVLVGPTLGLVTLVTSLITDAAFLVASPPPALVTLATTTTGDVSPSDTLSSLSAATALVGIESLRTDSSLLDDRILSSPLMERGGQQGQLYLLDVLKEPLTVFSRRCICPALIPPCR